jgi:hypothetical protein
MACASAMSVTGAFVAPVALVSGSKLSGKKMVLASSSSSLSKGFVSKLIVNDDFCSACRVEDYVSCCFDVMFKLLHTPFTLLRSSIRSCKFHKLRSALFCLLRLCAFRMIVVCEEDVCMSVSLCTSWRYYCSLSKLDFRNSEKS